MIIKRKSNLEFQRHTEEGGKEEQGDQENKKECRRCSITWKET